MTTLSTKVNSLVTVSPPSDVFHSTSEPVEIFKQAAGINDVTTAVIAALGHVALPTAGATTPAAGYPGEKITSAVLVGAAASLTTATPLTLASISLTAGDWTIDGSVQLSLAAATCTIASGGTSLTTNAADLAQYATELAPGTTTATQTLSHPVPARHIQVAATTVVYLVAAATFSAGAVSAYGSITARRAS